MLHRQGHVYSLLRLITDKVEIGYVARKTGPYWPLNSSSIYLIEDIYPIYKKSLVGNPQHATPERSQLET